MEDPIVIRLSLEHTQAQILLELAPYERELKERIEQAVHHAIHSFSFDTEIQIQVKHVVTNILHQKVQDTIDMILAHTLPSFLDDLIKSEVQRQLEVQV